MYDEERLQDLKGKVKLNLVPSEPDARDYLASNLITGVAATIPLPGEHYNYKPEEIKIYDQLNSNMCSGFAAMQAVRFSNNIEKGKLEDFSPAFVYANRRADDYIGEGDQLRYTLSRLRHFGMCPLSDFNYIGSYIEARTRYDKLPATVVENAKLQRIKEYYSVNSANPDEVKRVLFNYKSVLVCGIAVYPSFWNAAYKTKGIIPLPKPEEKLEGGHAIAIDGYKYIDGKLHYRVINSWGTDNGDNGIYWLPADYPRFEMWLLFDYVKFESKFKQGSDICYVNNKPVKIPRPVYQKEGRTMVPLRFIAELFGMTVEWKGDIQVIVVEEYLPELWINVPEKKITNVRSFKETVMDVGFEIKDGSTYAPIRFMAESLGLIVEWDAVNQFAIVKNF